MSCLNGVRLIYSTNARQTGNFLGDNVGCLCYKETGVRKVLVYCRAVLEVFTCT
jgi:hypothetical protein